MFDGGGNDDGSMCYEFFTPQRITRARQGKQFDGFYFFTRFRYDALRLSQGFFRAVTEEKLFERDYLYFVASSNISFTCVKKITFTYV